MKKRIGWVYNSSSSSFIISTEKGKQPENIKVTYTLDDCCNKTINNYDELIEHMKESLYWKANDQTEEEAMPEFMDKLKHNSMFNASKEALKEGKQVMIVEGNSEDYGGIGQMIYNDGLPESEDYDIIYHDY